MVTGAAKGLVKTADLATLGTFSSAGTRLGTFFGTDGTLEERAEAANEEGNRAQLNTVTLGFSEAEDKGEHARQLLRQTFAVDQFKQGSEQLAEGIVNDNLEQAVRGGAHILGGASQVTLVVAGTAQAAESVVGGGAEAGVGADAAATRARVTAAIEDSQQARAASNFAEHVERVKSALTTENAESPGIKAAGSEAPSSRVLGQNLEDAGITRPADSAAHHIVAGADERALEARAILRREGVGINDAENGVFLPKNSKVANPGGAQVHSRVSYRHLLRHREFYSA